MKSIDVRVTGRQASESARPQLAVVPTPRPYFTRVRSVKAGSPRNKSVLVALGSYADPETGACYPSITSLVTATELNRASVCRALNELERAGLISRQRSKGGRGAAACTRYRLNLPPQQSHSATPSSRRVRPLAVAGCDPKSHRKSQRKRPPNPPEGGGRAAALEVLSFLNLKASRHFKTEGKPAAKSLGFIEARLKEGATVEDMRSVIARKIREWGDDPHMSPNLKPSTLFNSVRYWEYQGQLGTDAGRERRQ